MGAGGEGGVKRTPSLMETTKAGKRKPFFLSSKARFWSRHRGADSKRKGGGERRVLTGPQLPKKERKKGGRKEKKSTKRLLSVNKALRRVPMTNRGMSGKKGGESRGSIIGILGSKKKGRAMTDEQWILDKNAGVVSGGGKGKGQKKGKQHDTKKRKKGRREGASSLFSKEAFCLEFGSI